MTRPDWQPIDTLKAKVGQVVKARGRDFGQLLKPYHHVQARWNGHSWESLDGMSTYRYLDDYDARV